MNDLLQEDPFPLTAARTFLPSGHYGKKVSKSTLFRWALKGCHGVKLETILIGGTRHTSLEAIARFVRKLGAVNQVSVPPSRENDVNAQLARLGI